MAPEELLEALTFLQHDLDEELDTISDESLWREKIFEYLKNVEKDLKFCIPPEAFNDTKNGLSNEVLFSRLGTLLFIPTYQI